MNEHLNMPTEPSLEDFISDATDEYLLHLKDAQLEALNEAERTIHLINEELKRRKKQIRKKACSDYLNQRKNARASHG